MIDGDWSDEEFLRLRPGERAAFLSDERLIGAEPPDEPATPAGSPASRGKGR